MKIKILLLSILFLTFNIFTSNAQSSKPSEYYKPNIANTDQFIEEVYGDQAKRLVFENPEVYIEIKNRLKSRISIVRSFQPIKDGYYPNLSSVKLQNKYNSDLKKDDNFDPLRFNPLKYKFDYDLKEKQIYRVDGENYLVIIDWKKNNLVI